MNSENIERKLHNTTIYAIDGLLKMLNTIEYVLSEFGHMDYEIDETQYKLMKDQLSSIELKMEQLKKKDDKN